ncbi:MAG: hypothetical protein ACKOE6_16425 [Flammeovirgaceae bacterium]
MKKSLLVILLMMVAWCGFGQTEGWSLFAKTKFETKYNEKAAEYFLTPNFPAELKAMVGKEVDLEGYYLPIDVAGNAYIVISKFPYSQCFFCGGAGPETIAEVTFKVTPGKFEADQFIRVKGKLKLNELDVDHVNFILTVAVLVKK